MVNAPAITSQDRQVLNKISASKNAYMTEDQIAISLPGIRAKEIKDSLNSLLANRHVTSTQRSGATVFAVAKTTSKAALTVEQKIVLTVIEKRTDRGISSAQLRAQIPPDKIPAVALRKALTDLDKGGHITSFKAVNAPTTLLYISLKYKPDKELTGGVWYDDNKEFDKPLVEMVRSVLLEFVQKRTFPSFPPKELEPLPDGAESGVRVAVQSRGKGKEPSFGIVDGKRPLSQSGHGDPKSTVNYPLWPAARTIKLPTPGVLLEHLTKLKIINVAINAQNIMEIMRALELDGLVEIIKPVGSIAGMEGLGFEEDEPGPSRKRRKGANGDGMDVDDDVDDEERERAAERARELEKERKKAKAKREKERERAKEKERRREKRAKEREKKERKKRKEKERKRERRKQKHGADDDSDAESDELRDVNDPSSPKAKKSSKYKSKKQRHSYSSSDSSSDLSSDSSDSDSDSDDSDNDSVSSVSSNDLDRVTSRRRKLPTLNAGADTITPAGLQDLSDTAVVYRAVNRFQISLGQRMIPCGNCPVFAFCEEGGPVNADDCGYWGDFLLGERGGWDHEEDDKRLAAQQAEEAERLAEKRARDMDSGAHQSPLGRIEEGLNGVWDQGQDGDNYGQAYNYGGE